MALIMYIWYYRVSATNCARTYELAEVQCEPADLKAQGWQFGSKLTTENVWNTFVLLSLVEDHQVRHMPLHLSHTGKQKDHFTDAMDEHNERLVLQGQLKIAHYCDKCMCTYKMEHGDCYKVEAPLWMA
jgi:hypothetical protein